MKKQLSAFIFAAVMTIVVNAGHAYGQFSQAIQADIPFAFSVGKKTLPEGTYTIRPVGDSRSIWRIEARDGTANQFILAGIVSGATEDEELRVTFHRYGTEHYLAGFTTEIYEVGLRKSSSEKGLRSPASTLPDMGVATVPARPLSKGDVQVERKEITNDEKRNK